MRSKPPLFLRGRIWWCYVRPPTGKGRRIPKTTKTQDYQAAVEIWRELERESARPANPLADAATLREALEARINERRAVGRSEGTIECLIKKARQLRRVFGMDAMLSEITAASVDGYIARRVAEGVHRSTIHKELSCLRGALKLARRHGKFITPLEHVMPTDFSPKYKPRERRLGLGEIEKLLAELSEERAAIVCFLLATGATYPSELAKKPIVDMATWMVTIFGTKRESRRRTIPIATFARPWLIRAMEFFPFTPWTNVRRELIRACKRAGIKRCSPNDLRRSVGSLMRARGIAPHLIGRFLGHADARMAERVYGKITPDELARLIEAPTVNNPSTVTAKNPQIVRESGSKIYH